MQAAGLAVPDDRPLDDLTAELTTDARAPPTRASATASPTRRWPPGSTAGVYDDLLAGLGDGMAAGLSVGLGEPDTDTVFRRSFSALVLAECIDRDNEPARCCPAARCSSGATGSRPGTPRAGPARLRPRQGLGARGRARRRRASARSAASPHLGRHELTVLLDVIADRLLLPVDRARSPRRARPAGAGHDDGAAPQRRAARRARAWVARLAAGAGAPRGDGDRDPFLAGGNAEAFLRALHLQLALGAATARRPRPTCCWCSSTRCGRPTRRTCARADG